MQINNYTLRSKKGNKINLVEYLGGTGADREKQQYLQKLHYELGREYSDASFFGSLSQVFFEKALARNN